MSPSCRIYLFTCPVKIEANKSFEELVQQQEHSCTFMWLNILYCQSSVFSKKRAKSTTETVEFLQSLFGIYVSKIY